MSILKKIDQWIEKGSSALLVISILSMILLAVSVIVLRWFNVTFHWIEPFIRHLVFLCAFLGGVLATGKGTHIGIDIIGKYLESQKKWDQLIWSQRIIALTCFVTCLFLVKSGYGFSLVEGKYGKVVFLGIHSQYLVSIIPVGFSLLAYRFFFNFLSSFQSEYRVQLIEKHSPKGLQGGVQEGLQGDSV